MVHVSRTRALVVAGVAASLTLAACGGGGTKQPTVPGSNSAAKGGTVTVYHASDFEHLDPARSFVTDSQMAGRLITRKLMDYKWDAKNKKVTLTHDLAESVTHSDDFKTWTFKLRSGLKYEDGSAIKAADIKYNVERSYVPDMQEGAPYAQNMIACQAGYKGPYAPAGNNGGKGCTGITAPDDQTVVFSLKAANPEFDHTATMPTFSPTPQAKDTKTTYDNRPFSSGPYKIETYTRKKELVLVRNTHWDQKTDELRNALPDKFHFIFGADEATVDQRLIQNGTADQASVSFSSVQPANLGKLLSASVKDRVVEGDDICRRYIAFNQSKPLLKDQKLREALAYGLDKQAWISGRGGDRLNTIVTSIIPEALPGYHDINPYPGPVTGDVAKAKALLAESGYKGETLVLGASDATATSIKAAEAAQASWARIGIKVEIKKIVGDNYYTIQQADASATDLITAGWCYDWASLATIVPSVLGPDGNDKTRTAQNNYARSRAGWDKLDSIFSMSDNKAAQEEWSKLYDEIMKTAPLVPISKDNNVYVVGSKIVNATPDPNTGGLIDLLQIGVKQG